MVRFSFIVVAQPLGASGNCRPPPFMGSPSLPPSEPPPDHADEGIIGLSESLHVMRNRILHLLEDGRKSPPSPDPFSPIANSLDLIVNDLAALSSHGKSPIPHINPDVEGEINGGSASRTPTMSDQEETRVLPSAEDLTRGQNPRTLAPELNHFEGPAPTGNVELKMPSMPSRSLVGNRNIPEAEKLVVIPNAVRGRVKLITEDLAQGWEEWKNTLIRALAGPMVPNTC